MNPYLGVVTDAGRRADRGDPVSLRLKRHRDRVVEIPSAVVDARKDVAVEWKSTAA